MFHQFNSSKFSITGSLCGQFAISIPIKRYSLSKDHIPDLLQSYGTLLSVSPGVCSTGRGAILLSVSAAGKGLMYTIDVKSHTQHLLHQGRDRKAKPFFQMPSLRLSQNYLLNIQTFCRLLVPIYAFYIPLL